MESSNCMGLMAVVAVSSSVAILAVQAHKRLTSDFMNKLFLEIGTKRNQSKKKVKFAPDVAEPSSNNKEYRRRRSMVPIKSNSMRKDLNVPVQFVN